MLLPHVVMGSLELAEAFAYRALHERIGVAGKLTQIVDRVGQIAWHLVRIGANNGAEAQYSAVLFGQILVVLL